MDCFKQYFQTPCSYGSHDFKSEVRTNPDNKNLQVEGYDFGKELMSQFSCYNKIPDTLCFNNRNALLVVLGPMKCRSSFCSGRGPGEDSALSVAIFSSPYMAFFCACMWRDSISPSLSLSCPLPSCLFLSLIKL